MLFLSAAKGFLVGLAFLVLCGCTADVTSGSSILSGEFQTTKTANYKTAVADYGDLVKTSTLTLEPRYLMSETLRYNGWSEVFFGEFNVSNNQQVKEGDLLVTFTKKGSEAELEGCRLAYERAVESFQKTSAELLDAAQAPGLSGIEAQLLMLDYEQYVLNETQEIAELEAQYDDAKAAFEDEYLYAPYDGVVSSFAVMSEGAPVASDKDLLTIKKSGSMLMVGKTSTSNFLYNMTVTVEYGKSDNRKTVTGRVVSTDKVMPEGSIKTEEIYVKLDESIPDSELTKAQMTVVTVQAKDALLVPRAALTIEEGRYYVSILNGDMVQKRYVLRGILGGTIGEQSAVILSGLEAGQTVILD